MPSPNVAPPLEPHRSSSHRIDPKAATPLFSPLRELGGVNLDPTTNRRGVGQRQSNLIAPPTSAPGHNTCNYGQAQVPALRHEVPYSTDNTGFLNIASQSP